MVQMELRMLPRPQYLRKLIDRKDNGRVKIITGLRRRGKAALLFVLY
jgi:predicted AAA+ superfamily ATPase